MLLGEGEEFGEICRSERGLRLGDISQEIQIDGKHLKWRSSEYTPRILVLQTF
jgi:hypothetical protein